MPQAAYCKKCKLEVMPGPVCPHCGQKLAANSLRLSWAYELAPAKDFMSWNSILRVALPALLLLMLLVIGVEWGRKGFLGVQVLFAQGFWALLLLLAAIMLLVTWAALLMRGRVQVRYVLDNKGIHAQIWQVKPSFVKRIFRMVPDEAQTDPLGQTGWMLEEKHIPWPMLRRVGVWADRDKILVYSPRFWLCLTVHCLPDTYFDAVCYLYGQVKKRPGVMKAPPMPEETPSSQL